MKKISCFTFWLLFVFMLSANVIQAQLADSPWPMFMHDARHTGRSPYIGPSQPNLAWEKRVSNNKLIIGKNGIIYTYHSQDGYLALRLDGTVAYTGDVARVQVVTKDNTIYFKHDSTLYALHPDGTKKWELDVGGSGIGNIVLNAQGIISLNDGYNFSSIDPSGILFWKIPLTPDVTGAFPKRLVCNPTIGQDGTVYIVDYDGLKAYTQEGNLKWKFSIWPKDDCSNSISIGDDGTIYFGRGSTFSSYPLLYAFNADGTKKWEVKKISDPDISYDQERGVRSPAAIGLDGTIYFGENVWFPDHGFLYSVNADGSIRWTYKAKKGFPGSPIVDTEGKVFAVSGVGDLYCFDSNGTVLWQYNIFTPYGANINFSYPAIDSLGTLYVVAGEYSGNKLCAFFNINPTNTPDLSVISDSITFNPPSGTAISGNQVKIKVPIKEVGGFQSAAFDVIFYANDFSNTIDSVRGYAPANYTAHVEGTWNTEGLKAKTYQIFIKVKNANPPESDISNNQGQSSFTLLPSLQERIDKASAGDTVWVAPGTYYENLTLKKGVVVKSTHGPEQTIIDGREKNSVIKALHLDPTAVIEGFTLTNGYQSTFGGGGIYIERGGVTIRNNIICDNRATNGGAIWMIGSFVESDPVIENNLIINNHASFDGGAVYANNSWALFRNNTVINNRSSFSDMTGGIHTVGYYSPSAGIVNCIICGNGINLGGTASAIYSCIENGSTGTGNIFVEPRFVAPANGDYSLQPDSPCIDTGDPASPRDPDGTRADMGWKYYDQSATIARIMGHLTDATTGGPVTMAKIYLSGPRNDLVPPDTKGNYVFAVPSDNGYRVSVFAPNHSSAMREHVSAHIGAAAIIDFSLTPYPTKITLYPPSKLKGNYTDGKVHLTWQRPLDEQAFDDGYYEASVGFKNSQGILVAGPFKPTNYPAKIEKIKVAFDGERTGDKIELLIYLDNSGTATKPASSMLVFNRPNLPIEVGGGFQEIDISNEGVTLNTGTCFIGIKQVNTKPMYMLLDQSSADGHAFVDDNLDGVFESLASSNIHGALAVRTIVSMPTGGTFASLTDQIILPALNSALNDSMRRQAAEKNLPTGLIARPIVSSKNSKILDEEINALNLLAIPPQSIYVYRSINSPVELSNTNKIATLAASSIYYDDMNLGSSEGYYYIVAARYADGTIIPSEEILVSISTAIGEATTMMIPDKFELSQNNPNPFNPETTIKYQIPNTSDVTITIYNINGQLVKTLVDQKQIAGYYFVNWNGKDNIGQDVSSGIYFYYLKAKNSSVSSGQTFMQKRKMVLVR